jgi:hypothetical protein
VTAANRTAMILAVRMGSNRIGTGHTSRTVRAHAKAPGLSPRGLSRSCQTSLITP